MANDNLPLLHLHLLFLFPLEPPTSTIITTTGAKTTFRTTTRKLFDDISNDENGNLLYCPFIQFFHGIINFHDLKPCEFTNNIVKTK